MGQPGPALHLRASRGRLRAGQKLRLAGAAPIADDGARVVLERAPSAAAALGAVWRPDATARVGRQGRFVFRLSPTRSAVYRAVVAVTPVAQLTSSSAPLRVAVGAHFAVVRRRLDLTGRGRISVTGRLAPSSAGRVVELERRGRGGWRPVARRLTGARGSFALSWRPARLPVRLRLAFAGDRANAGAVAGLGRALMLSPSVASWYYDGGATACGFHASLGVANRTLPCGTRVTIRHGPHTVTAVVDDRGPYVWGRDWDLSETTAAALGFSGVGVVWVAG
ncbi:MAG: septal ring lytic transglycosylase RlpA family protein [Solirubrobacteraceae bacterium]